MNKRCLSLFTYIVYLQHWLRIPIVSRLVVIIQLVLHEEQLIITIVSLNRGKTSKTDEDK